jgi:hypothetical protein
MAEGGHNSERIVVGTGPAIKPPVPITFKPFKPFKPFKSNFQTSLNMTQGRTNMAEKFYH